MRCAHFGVIGRADRRPTGVEAGQGDFGAIGVIRGDRGRVALRAVLVCSGRGARLRRRSVPAFIWLLAASLTSACGLVIVGSATPAEEGADASSVEGSSEVAASPVDRADRDEGDANADAASCGRCSSGFACVGGVCADRARERFTLSANPSGNWTYGWRVVAATGTGIVPYDRAFTDRQNAGIECWARDDAGVTPGVFRNPSTNVVHPYASFTMAPGDLAFHPGSLGENSVVRWTAPAAGSYRATVAVRGLSGYNGTPPTTTGVTVLKGAAIVGSAQLGALDAGAEIDLPPTSFAAGETFDVRVDEGADKNYDYDSTGVDVTVFAL